MSPTNSPVYLLLDRMRETQLQQNQMLDEIIRLTKSEKTGTSALSQWLPLVKAVLGLLLQSVTGILCVAYALKGGDIMTAATTLLKLL
jgi:hypothetical protein